MSLQFEAKLKGDNKIVLNVTFVPNMIHIFPPY